MNCSHCGTLLQADARFCHRCGAAVPSSMPPVTASPASQPPPLRPGRGGVILVLGILAVLIFGPITGIPAWIMGQSDLKLIRAGIIPQHEHGMTMAGMVLGIVGTAIGAIVLLGIAVAITIATMGLRHEFSSLLISFGAGLGIS